MPSFIRAVRYSLQFAVLLFKLALHFKVDLALTFDALLFHIANDALVHGLDVER